MEFYAWALILMALTGGALLFTGEPVLILVGLAVIAYVVSKGIR